MKRAKLSRLSNTTPPLHAVEGFIIALTAASDGMCSDSMVLPCFSNLFFGCDLDGRVTFSNVDGQVEIKYQHLNPATPFRDIVEVARSVVLAGGTMSPVSNLFPLHFIHFRFNDALF